MFPADEAPVAQFEPGPGMEAFEELPAINKCVVTEEEFRTGTSRALGAIRRSSVLADRVEPAI